MAQYNYNQFMYKMQFSLQPVKKKKKIRHSNNTLDIFTSVIHFKENYVKTKKKKRSLFSGRCFCFVLDTK